ncbi:DUF721 domain-containing protein [Candidatus Peregrinibacteria bacterium]|nr:DUF721 domain-containing protein [Candidatus Peregrinibacteria bacterium]
MSERPEFKNGFWQAKRTNSPADFHLLLAQTAQKLGVGTEVEAARVCHLARQELQELLPDFAHLAKVKSFQKGILTIVAITPAVLTRINSKKHLLLERINQKKLPTPIKKILLKSHQPEETLDYLDNNAS